MCVCVCVCVCVCACVQTHVHTSEKQRPDGLTPLLCLCPDHALCQWPCKEVPQEAVKDCQNLPLVSWNAWWTYKLGDGNDDDGKLTRCSVFSCSSCPGRSLSKGTQEKGLKGIMEGKKIKAVQEKNRQYSVRAPVAEICRPVSLKLLWMNEWKL